MLISIVLPIKDEASTESLLFQIHKTLKPYKVEVLQQHEKGLSNAVWHGIQRAKGDIVAVMDADGSHSPFYILLMLKMLNEKNHVVVGYKHIDRNSFLRRQTSKLFSFLARSMLRLQLHDPLSGFLVGYKKSFCFKERSGFKFGLEVILANERHVAEFPIVFQKRRTGRSKATPLEGIRTLFKILRLSAETGRILPKLPETLRQTVGFMFVGAGGAVVNGVVYGFLSQYAMFRTVPLPFWLFKEITWAWGIGILVAFIFNFLLDKHLIFKA